MRRIFTILAAFLMVGTFAFAQAAPQTETKPKAEKTAKAPKATTARGEIVKSDATSVTLKTAKGEESFAVNADTKITQGKKTLTTADLAAGERAVVSYTKAGDQMTATKIAVMAKAAPKGEKKEPKKEEKK